MKPVLNLPNQLAMIHKRCLLSLFYQISNPKKVLENSPLLPRGIYCPIIRERGGGGDKTCTFEVFWGRKPVPKKRRSHFHSKVGKFYIFLEIIAHNAIKSSYLGSLG